MDPKLKYFIITLAAITGAVLLSRLLNYLMDRYAIRSEDKVHIDSTQFRFFKNAVSLIIYTAAIVVIFYSIPTLRALGITLFASAGVLTVVLGFASQQAFSNIISGIFIVLFKPFRVEDIIQLEDGKTGVVEDITLRHTVIRSFENRRFVIPNSVISSDTITNFNLVDEKICRFVEMGISYDSNIDTALAIMEDEALKHPLHIDNRTEEEKANGDPVVRTKVIGFGDSSVNLRAWVWAANQGDSFAMGTDLNKSIKERFDREGIEIPFPYRTLVLKDPSQWKGNKE